MATVLTTYLAACLIARAWFGLFCKLYEKTHEGEGKLSDSYEPSAWFLPMYVDGVVLELCVNSMYGSDG